MSIPMNPYSAPAPYTSSTQAAPTGEEPAPAFALYDQGAVVLATFLGSIAAGAAVLAINFHRLGKPILAWTTFGLGVIVSVAVTAVVMMLPDNFPMMYCWIPQLIAMSLIAKANQGEAVTYHLAHGGAKGSYWKAAGIGLIGLAVVGGALLGYFFVQQSRLGTKLEYSKVEEIYYSNQATEADARKLGDALKALEIFNGDREKTVLLSKDEKGTSVSFVTPAHSWNDPAAIASFQLVGEKLVAAGVGEPLTIRFCDDELNVQKEIPIKR